MPGKMGFSRVLRRLDAGRVIFGAFRELADKLAFRYNQNWRKCVGGSHFLENPLPTSYLAQFSGRLPAVPVSFGGNQSGK